jgi:hypothetical protein
MTPRLTPVISMKFFWILLLSSFVEASLTMRPVFKSLAKMEEFDDMVNAHVIDLKSNISFKVDDFVTMKAGRIVLPSYPSKFLLASLLDAVKRNASGFEVITYSSKVLSNPSILTSLMVEVIFDHNFSIIYSFYSSFKMSE